MIGGAHDDLKPTEDDLVGAWVVEGAQVHGDASCLRIEWLIRERLEPLGRDETGWNTLFRDARDGRLWELTYPQSDLHGGGPPRLSAIDSQAAEAKYQWHTA